MGFSMTQSGNLVVFLSSLFALFGHNITGSELEATAKVIAAVIAIIGAAISWIGRFRKGDLKFSGRRKKEETNF